MLLYHPPLFDFAKRWQRRFLGFPEDQLFLIKAAKSSQIKTVMQIGANDGIRNDPVRELVVNCGLDGIFVEPDPAAFSELKRSYSHLINRGHRLSFVNAFCTEGEGTHEFYTLSPKIRSKLTRKRELALTRKASTDRNRFVRHLASIGYHDAENLVEPAHIKTVKWDDLFKEFGVPDLLVLDTEGLDWRLMADLDLSQYTPKIIFFEHGNLTHSLSKEVKTMFEQHGYHYRQFQYNSSFWKNIPASQTGS